MEAFATILCDAEDKPEENKVHRIKPERAKTGYGKLSEGTDRAFPKKRVKIIIKKRGCKTAQRIPRTDCLYFTLISLQVKK